MILLKTGSGQIYLSDRASKKTGHDITLQNARVVTPITLVVPCTSILPISTNEMIAGIVRGGDIARYCTLGPEIPSIKIHLPDWTMEIGACTYQSTERDYIRDNRNNGCRCTYSRRHSIGHLDDPIKITRTYPESGGCPLHCADEKQRHRNVALLEATATTLERKALLAGLTLRLATRKQHLETAALTRLRKPTLRKHTEVIS